ncbi:MAG TPA: hypothetical protein VM580_23140 [Labilithrix sp.]|nr:hypothetical protein [Labilithrix sp.]
MLAPLVSIGALMSCKDASSSVATPPVDSCAALFGAPNDQTGLDSDQCRPQCACNGATFTSPSYDAAFIDSLVSDWKLASPFPLLTSDPYESAPPPEDPPDTVCGVLPSGDPSVKPRPYTLVTYTSEAEARAAGAFVTHFGRCGVCSPLVDLAVYMRERDLVAPVRACGFKPDSDAGDPKLECLENLGFDRACAQIWKYNTAHTRESCTAICIANLTQSYNLEDGGLNPCLQCDEDKSGAVFKAVAGRTRRNTGLPNAICRPCAEVRPLVHRYEPSTP